MSFLYHVPLLMLRRYFKYPFYPFLAASGQLLQLTAERVALALFPVKFVLHLTNQCA